MNNVEISKEELIQRLILQFFKCATQEELEVEVRPREILIKSTEIADAFCLLLIS